MFGWKSWKPNVGLKKKIILLSVWKLKWMLEVLMMIWLIIFGMVNDYWNVIVVGKKNCEESECVDCVCKNRVCCGRDDG